MKKRNLFVIGVCLLLGISIQTAAAAEDVSGPGDIAFTGFNGVGDGDLAFVLLSDVPEGTVIHFTDNEWTDSAFNTGEGEIQWQAPLGGLTAGIVIVISETNLSSVSVNLGTVTRSGTFDIASSNESIMAFLGDISSPTAFLSAIGNETDSSYRPNVTNTGLAAGDCIVIGGDFDVMAYNGARDNQSTVDDYRAQINDETNWIVDEGSSSYDDEDPPDVPFDPTPFTKFPSAIRLSDFKVKSISNQAMVGALVLLSMILGGMIIIRNR